MGDFKKSLTPSNWAKQFREQTLVELKLAGLTISLDNIPQIIKYMSFKERSVRNKGLPYESGGCPCYNAGKPCHSNIPDFNCFLCPCPNWDYSNPQGTCRGGGKGKRLGNGYWDCSDCTKGHSPAEVESYLRENMVQLAEQQAKL
jgi:Zn-finger protein